MFHIEQGRITKEYFEYLKEAASDGDEFDSTTVRLLIREIEFLRKELSEG